MTTEGALMQTPRKKRKTSKEEGGAVSNRVVARSEPPPLRHAAVSGSPRGLQECAEGRGFRLPADFTTVTAPCSLACSSLSSDQELWLLQLPLSWQANGSIMVSLAQDAAGNEIWTCQDDSGSRFRLAPEHESIANQVWGFAPRSGNSMPVQVKQRVTVITSENEPQLPPETEQWTLSAADVANTSSIPEHKGEVCQLPSDKAVAYDQVASELQPGPVQKLKVGRHKKDKKRKHKHKQKNSDASKLQAKNF